MTRPIAVVTGASRGIGTAIAEKLAQDGFHVVLNFNRNGVQAEALKSKLDAQGLSSTLAQFDVSNSEQVDEKFDWIGKNLGPTQVLVNNAGITVDSLLIRMKDEDVDRMIDVDLKGAMYCTRSAARQMMKARAGSIIQISSVIGEMGNAGQSGYSAAKAGLIGFTKSVAKELGSRNIRANVVTPGFIQTEMTEGLTDAQKEAILRNIPLGFLGLPEDVANCVAFLASPASRYVTGQILGINGGLYI